ncbi:MAG: hypothetical protein IKZ98_06060 [Clostridia bacterium]|nr:hypothetical protein [Clostridia bacterium]
MTTVKKTHWFRNTLIVLIICGLIGTVLAAVLFFGESNQTFATAAIQFSFDGAAKGMAPNGYAFDVSGITSDEVLEKGLEASGLTGSYTVEDIRASMNVTGVYPERIAEQMTKYVSLLDTEADMQAALSDYHATRYSVTLYNNFDQNIGSGKLMELLQNILTIYRSYFAKTYSASLETTDPITDLQEYDYAQQLEAIRTGVNQDSRFALEIQELAPDFQLNRKSFGDIVVRYQNLGKDIDRLEATITLNAVSKDRTRLQKRYEMEIRTQGFQLESLQEELKQIEEQVNAFEKDGIIYVSANGALSRVGSESSDTYDKLVEKRKNVSDQIAEINATIALYQARLDDMTGVAAKAAEAAGEAEDVTAVEELTAAEKAALKAEVGKKINTLQIKRDSVRRDFAAMLDAYAAQEINEKTVSVSGLKFKSPSILSGAFVVKAIRTAGPICAVGFMVCMVLLIIRRRKEGKS